MTTDAVIGVDIGTSSSKGVLVTINGSILTTVVRKHVVSRPTPGQVEMDARVWWDEFVAIARELTASQAARANNVRVVGVGVSGMGPCVLITDADGKPLRPAILYGVDTRAVEEIAELTAELGGQAIVARCGSSLSTQAVGPKLVWIERYEPLIADSAQRLFMPSSYLVYHLTGEYVLDHHSASQCAPMYDTRTLSWYEPWASRVLDGFGGGQGFDLPRLQWPGDIVGTVSAGASTETGIPVGVPVIAGTIDAWAEAVSVGADSAGDLMLMYGTTMFLINTVSDRAVSSAMWGTVGAYPGTYNLAGGMATSGAITNWLRDLYGAPDFSTLLAEADGSGAGARGLLMLPYFAGERTPIADPDARGLIAGLSMETTRGDIYRAALEATAFGVRHNVETFQALGYPVNRTVAVGGGTQGGLWTQIVSDISGLDQIIPTVTIGASFGGAFLAASAVAPTSIAEWNPSAATTSPRLESKHLHDDLYEMYLDLYDSTKVITHKLARNLSERH